MFLILILMSIISINTTYAYTQDSEIILLPAWNTTEVKEISLTFKVFGKLMQLNLRRKNQVVSSAFEMWKNNKKDVTEKLSKIKELDFCFHLYDDHVSSAVINICQEHGLEGLFLVENNLLEIWPLQNVFASSSFIKDYCVKEQINQSFGKPHFVKRSLQSFTDSDFYHLYKKSKRHYTSSKLYDEVSKTIELAVFVEAKAYNLMMKLLHFNIEKVLDVMLSYVNRIQVLYHHPSLGVRIDISLVRLEFMEEQLSNLLTYSNNKIVILESFCNYTKNLNPLSDNDPRHWDISLFITGLKLVEPLDIIVAKIPWAINLGVAKSYEPCTVNISCAMVTLFPEEFENTKELGQIARFEELAEQSSVTAAHEIGHLLGLEHDSKVECFIYLEYIMCEGKLPYREIKWSPLSRKEINLRLKYYLCLFDHTQPQIYDNDGNWSTYALNISFRSHNFPGRRYTAKRQCELLLHDENANVVTLHDICRYLQCELSNSEKTYFFPRRTLQGTYCSYGKECHNGECVPIIEPPYNFNYCERDNWSEWREDKCDSKCLKNSKGIVAKRRFCKHRHRKTANCAGPYYDVVLCDDSSLCTEKRRTIAEFTTKKCFEFSTFVKNANMTLELLIASGSQMLHDSEKPWLACTVFCRRKDTSDWYTARENMFDHSVDPYFPDGTWCHNKNGQDYFCRQHYCLSENYSFVEFEKCKDNC